jgi:DNA-directed RNA polymerase specialized sigma24 family protein
LSEVTGILSAIEQGDPHAAVLVKLRFFGGMTMGEAADVLGISVRSTQDLWSYARTWLRRGMRSG